METDTNGRPRKARRTANACVACRQSKIKCSGDDPCQNCTKRSLRCQFAEGVHKVVVTEKYLQDLLRQAEKGRQSLPATNLDSPAQAAVQYRDSYSSPASSHSAPVRTTQSCNSPPQSRGLSVPDEPHPRQQPQLNPTFTSANFRPSSGAAALVSPASTAGAPQRVEAGPDPTALPPPQDAASPLNVWPSVFPMPAKTIRNGQKNRRTWIWLAPWSTWSCTMRLLLLLKETLHPEDPDLPTNVVDPELYTLTWETTPPDSPPDISGLPSQNHALYLFNTAKFHLGHSYKLFNEESFEVEINEFYLNAPQRALDSRLWFAKFLLVLAFGTAFHAPPSDSQEPPGAKLFTRAMALIPNSTAIWKESVLAVEVLALASLYLFSVGEREAAHIHLGQAIRIAQLEGLHTQLPERELGMETIRDCRDLWWTLYIMDRHFSCSLGLPMSVMDSDITTPVHPPNLGSVADSARSLQVNLSHILSVILTTVYKPTTIPLDTFLEQTKSILHTLARNAQEIERIISLKLQSSVGTIPRGTSNITLLYHQCVIVATRPLLLSVLKERLDMLEHPGDERWHSFLAQTGAAISTGIRSAAKTLQILNSEYGLIETFLPHDVEFTFGAALHLTIAGALFPDVVDYPKCHQLAHQILNTFVTRGNRVARARKAELCHLEALCHELVIRVQQQGHQILHLLYPDITTADFSRKERLAEGESGALDMGEDLNHHVPPFSNNMDYLDDIGISSEEFLSIIQLMGNPGTPQDSIFDAKLARWAGVP